MTSPIKKLYPALCGVLLLSAITIAMTRASGKEQPPKFKGYSFMSAYVQIESIRMEEIGPIFECFQCGAIATVVNYVQLTYKHTGDSLTYAFVECVGEHARYPVPFDWFDERVPV